VSTASLFVEAVDTLCTLLRAATVWVILCSIAAALGLYTIAVAVVATIRGLWRAGCWAWRTAARRTTRPSWARGRLAARRYARTRPHWAHTQPLDHEWDEAA
jgi:hypothetical protein